jgi:hypothetical protein
MRRKNIYNFEILFKIGTANSELQFVIKTGKYTPCKEYREMLRRTAVLTFVKSLSLRETRNVRKPFILYIGLKTLKIC